MLRKLTTLAVAGLGIAAAKVVDFNREIARSYAGNGVTFLADMKEVDIGNNLMAVGRYYNEEDRIACTVEEQKANSGEVTVLLAISKCLNDSSIQMINEWVDKIKDQELSYFVDNQLVEINFATTLLPDQCEARSEKNKHGFNNQFDDSWQEGEGGYEVLMANEAQVQPHELERIASFAKFGRVLNAVPTGEKDDLPIAVISFVNSERSYNEVQQFERTFQIDKVFNFQICEGGESCKGHFENCIFLKEGVDLFMYNPFTVTRSFYCRALGGGVPVTYIDRRGDRQCFCACPAGYELAEEPYRGKFCKRVEPEVCPCEWSKQAYGYKHENTEKLQKCEFKKIASNWGVHVPFPMDNYVADNRVNNQDNGYLTNGPHVDVSTDSINDWIISHEYVLAHQDAYTASGLPESISEFNHDYDMNIVRRLRSNSRVQTDHYTWREYQNNRQDAIDALTYTSYGKYTLDLYANDYSDDATCHGCVAIVDKYRPRATTECPATFCDNTTSTCKGYEEATSELTVDNLQKADRHVKKFYKYQSEAVNDACSGDNRCDAEFYSLKNFFEDEYCQDNQFTDGKQCFDPETVRHDFIENVKSSQNPLVVHEGYRWHVVQSERPIPQGQCTRCCSLDVKLREKWTDFTCSYDYNMQYCDGLESEQCAWKQCLTMNGDTLATAAARIRKDVVEESEKVIEQLVQKGFQTHTQIHRSLQCTAFGGSDGECDFRAKMSDLIETQVRSNFELGYGADIEDFVFWRYKVNGDEGGWRLLHVGAEEGGRGVGHRQMVNREHVFDKPETKITIEAWTNCGIVRKFFFYVHLHLNSEIRVCDKFADMWYQTSVSRLPVANNLCAYPQSDFAELTFDYHANVGLQYHRNNLRMNITSVVCTMSIEGKSPAEILRVEDENADIVKRFAVELVNQHTTEPRTEFRVECAFTYTRFDQSTVTHTCPRDFSIKDCDGPKIDLPDGECQFDTCAGSGAPGPFEACGGNVVRSNADSTYFDTEDHRCCQSCYSRTRCVPVLGLPNRHEDIKRCVPQIDDHGYGYGGESEDIQASEAEPEIVGEIVEVRDSEDNNASEDPNAQVEPQFLLAKAKATIGANHTVLLGLVGGTALVAVIALVVAKRSRAAAPKAAEQDAYYPLLQ